MRFRKERQLDWMRLLKKVVPAPIYLGPKNLDTFWWTGWVWNCQIIFRFASILGRSCFILINSYYTKNKHIHLCGCQVVFSKRFLSNSIHYIDNVFWFKRKSYDAMSMTSLASQVAPALNSKHIWWHLFLGLIEYLNAIWLAYLSLAFSFIKDVWIHLFFLQNLTQYGNFNIIKPPSCLHRPLATLTQKSSFNIRKKCFCRLYSTDSVPQTFELSPFIH